MYCECGGGRVNGEKGKSIRGNVWDLLHFYSVKYPIAAFFLPHTRQKILGDKSPNPYFLLNK